MFNILRFSAFFQNKMSHKLPAGAPSPPAATWHLKSEMVIIPVFTANVVPIPNLQKWH
jgi:hypothetical protein